MIGLFFGSFDPPHIGHVNVVTAALNSGSVDIVYVVPAYKSVWKSTETSYDDRVHMCNYTFKIPRVLVSRIEGGIAEGKPLPTYRVLEVFEELLEGESFVIITTSETYAEIPRWEHGKEILAKYNFLIVCSRHFSDTTFTLRSSDKVVYAPDINMCSTNLREKIKNGKIVQPFVQDDVINIINALGLYK